MDAPLAIDIARQVRAGEITAQAVMVDTLERLEAAQAQLNTYTSIDHHASLTRAAEVDAMVQAGRDPGVLAGVPVAVKDLIDQAGQVTTAGSKFYRVTPDESAHCISALEQAGAVMVSRTGLHEFAFGFSSENAWFGPVRNPWDTETSPGGSSGGSAVAVAAGLTPLSLGTDTGGSVRVPAALCGTFGLKVTHGRISLRGVVPLAGSVDTVGPFARTATDLGLAYEVMAGYDPQDPWSAPGSRSVDLPSKLTFGIPQPWVDEAPMTQQVLDSFREACADLRALGHTVVSISIEEFIPPGMISEATYPEVAEVHRAWWEADQPYGPDVGARLSAAFSLPPDDFVAAERWRAMLRNRVAAAFEKVDLLITPGVAALRKEIGVEDIETLHGPMSYRPVVSWFSALVNQTQLPAIVAPLRQTGSPPPSLQIIGPWWSESGLLSVTQFLEDSGMVGFAAPPSH